MENKQTRGRQKIDTSKRRETEEDRMVTFSKRRNGLYKKASELCTLCGTELLVLAFSPSGKPFSFAYPNIETIAKRFLNMDFQSANRDISEVESKIKELNEQLSQLSVEAEIEKERAWKITQMERRRRNKPICDGKISELGDGDAETLKVWLLELREKINGQRELLALADLSNGPLVDPNVGSPSHGYGCKFF